MARPGGHEGRKALGGVPQTPHPINPATTTIYIQEEKHHDKVFCELQDPGRAEEVL